MACQGKEGLVEPYNGAVKRCHAKAWRVWWNPTMEQLKGGMQGMEGLVEPYSGAVKRWQAKVWRVWWNLTVEQLKGGMPRQGGSGGTLQWSS